MCTHKMSQNFFLPFTLRRMGNEFIAMFRVTSPVVINVPTRGLLSVETMTTFVRWLANSNINRNI